MNPPVQPGADTRDNQDSGVFRRRTSVTESGAQSTNFACRPADGTLQVSTTSTDGTFCAAGMTLDGVSELATTLAGAAVSTVVAPVTASAVRGHRPQNRHRLHLAHFSRNAPIRGATAES